jgi:hypothetical protein
MKILAAHLPKDSLLWLETDNERFLSIWQQDRSGLPKGAVLIVHAEGENPTWPNTTKPLHDTLPNHGWATLAISLPEPDALQTPSRTLPVKTHPVEPAIAMETETSEGSTSAPADIKQPESTNSPATNEKPQPDSPLANTMSAETIVEKRLETAMQFLHDRGQFNIILIGSGVGAIRAHEFLNKITPKINNPKLKAKLERPVRAMVLVNARNQLPMAEDSFNNWFSDPDIPVLDIFVQTDRRNTQEAAARKILAQQKKVTAYKQVRITELSHEKSWSENQLSRRVRSFLDSNAVGIEVKNATLRKYK